ncbi:permease prefix domain 1-containing protein [Agromyces sp. SYSU T00194]|uniref:permease prefix domain 1-containing protein n=1 Tax=Agromyces chitinivorans TaxID=3158560 RepID=UPI0033972EC4
MTTLTDRYVQATARYLPERQRAELARELRERIGDRRDAMIDEGHDPADAERATLVELGDPAVLAAGYADRPMQLIGPRTYLAWLRVLKLVLAIALPVVAGISLLAQLLSGATAGEVAAGVFGAVLNTALQVLFWVTLVFALIDRSPANVTARTWTPAQLPPIHDEYRAKRLPDLVFSLVALTAFAVLIVWQQAGFTVNGATVTFLDPALWSFWIPWFLVLIALEMAFAGAVYAWGWNWWLALANVPLNLAFAVPALWLFTSGMLVSPAFLDAVGWPWGEASDVIVTIVVVLFVLGAVADIVDGAVKASRAGRARAIA